MSNIKYINNEQAENLIEENDELLILDVRSANEFEESRISNAINIPVDELEEEFYELEDYKDRPILVYCKSGKKSSVACNLMEEEGFSNLYNLRDGISDYEGPTVSK
ncbi:rhodanese-like domain-containing protein [Clostridium sp. UBA6640]|uniref:rhodanese-like domain-containing protein n=1 Tax=Clostridium sp. UBA6640 TaxID=1946370 RepID=UPI0025C3AA4A|nr:rhodanese-like domain-containing protein [Clostridium sp. UBA6640]